MHHRDRARGRIGDGVGKPLQQKIGAEPVVAVPVGDVNVAQASTEGADPVAYAIAYASGLSTRFIRAFTVRKEAKLHGTAQLIEGPFLPGDRVAIVEDVITTGASALRAASAVQSNGGVVAGILAVVDRNEGGKEALQKQGFPVIALTTAADIIDRMS